MVVEGRLLTTLSPGRGSSSRGDDEEGVTGDTSLVMDTSVQEVTVRCRTPFGRGSLR